MADSNSSTPSENEARGATSGGWERIRLGHAVDGITFRKSGAVEIDGNEYLPYVTISSMEGTKVGRVTKTAGSEPELWVKTSRGQNHYRFEKGQWYKWEGEPRARGMSDLLRRAKQWLASPQAPDLRALKSQFRVIGLSYWKYAVLVSLVLVVLITAKRLWRWRADAAPLRQAAEHIAEIDALTEKANQAAKNLNAAEAALQKRQQSLDARLAQLKATEVKVSSTEQRQATAIAERKQRTVLYQNGFQELQRQGEALLERHATLQAEIKLWETSVPELLSNTAGRCLAANEEHVRTFVHEYGKVRMSPAAASALRAEIESLLDPIRRAARQDDLADGPVGELSAGLAAKGQEIEQAIREYREPRELLQSLAKQNKPSTMTLGEAIDTLNMSDAAKTAKSVADEVQELQQRLNEEEGDRERRQLEKRLEEDQKADAIAAEAAAEQNTHDELVRAAKSPKVRKALAFFTAKGYYQPFRANGTAGLERTTEAAPISLSRLQRSNMLDPGDTQSLAYLHQLLSSNLDSKRQSWPPVQSLANVSDDKLEELKAIQKYLNEYGPVLVELGILAE